MLDILDNNESNKLLDLIELQKQLHENLIFQFQNNMQALKEFMPDLYKRFKNYKVKEPFEFFCMDNGIANIQFSTTGEIFYSSNNPQETINQEVYDFLHSSHPKKAFFTTETDIFGQIHHRYNNELVSLLNKENINISQQGSLIGELQSMPFLIMYGLGLGYPLSSFYSNIELANLFVIEPNEDLFYASLHTFDYASLLLFLQDNKYKIHFCVGKKGDDVLIELLQFIHENGRFISGCSSFYVHYVSDDIKNISEYISQNYNKTHASMGFFDDNLFGLSHALDHVKHGYKFLQENKHLSKNTNSYPVFLIGNGPSLDRDLDFLRKNQDKALIVACGTAIDSLYNAGIKPDFYAVMERGAYIQETLAMFDNSNFLDDIIAITLDIIHPTTLEKFNNFAIFSKKDDPFYVLLANYSKTKKLSQNLKDINYTNPLVANLGFASVVYLGFENIYLFGVDNGKKKGYDLHSKNSALYNKLGTIEVKDSYALSSQREGNLGGVVESNYLFNLSADYIDRVIFTFKDKLNLSVYNCTDGQKLQYAITKESSSIDTSKWKVIDKEKVRDEFNSKITFKPDLDLDEIYKLIDKDKYNSFIDKIIALLNQKVTSRVEFTQKLQDVCYVMNQDKSNIFNSFMIEGSLQSFFILIQDGLYHKENQDLSLEFANTLLQRCIYFLEDSKKLFSYLPSYIVNEHKKLTNFKVGFDHTNSKAIAAPDDYVAVTKKENLKDILPFVKRYQ